MKHLPQLVPRQLRIIGPSKDPSNSDLASANANWIVRINEHLSINDATGV